jgi:hypothetical protein
MEFFPDLESLRQSMSSLGVDRMYVKPLAENDNTKQQIYLGGSFDAVNTLPYNKLGQDGTTFKAELDFRWLSANGQTEPAKDAKLILYPDYPEVRLSGFLRGCKIAPSQYLQPVKKSERKKLGAGDGRYLILGITTAGTIYAHLSTLDSALSKQVQAEIDSGKASKLNIFYELKFAEKDAKDELLVLLKSVHTGGSRPPVKLVGVGVIPIKITSPHASGYTLEAALGIEPNGKAEPDFKGWEVKTFSGSRITVMTPEPDGGYYAVKGCEQFLRKYGITSAEDQKIRYTGQHVVDQVQIKHNMKLILDGYDAAKNKLTNPSGALRLVDQKTGNDAASWSFLALVDHWAKKHSKAVYVPCKNDGSGFVYASPVWLCEGTDFTLFLAAMVKKTCMYDPGSSLAPSPPFAKKELKARNQFRVTKAGIAALYHSAISTALK